MTHQTPVAAERGGKGTAPLTITRVNPLDHAEAIKQLFVTHERPEFPAFFDRAYPEAVAEGANGWVGRDAAGRICGYVAQFPRRFAFGDQVVRGALLGNLMVATAYRTFFPGVSLLRRAVTDLRESGTVDFVYGDPNELARPVAEAAGLREVGALRRFVLPLSDRRAAIGLGIRAYRVVKRWQTRAVPLVASEGRRGDEPAPTNLSPVGDPRSLRPLRTPSIYRGRLAGYPAPGDRWYAIRQDAAQGALVGRALVRGPDAHGVAILCVWECEPLTRLSAALVTLGDHVRERGAERLEVYVMAASRAERDFRRAGFLLREEFVPVLARAFTTLGSEVVAAAAEWRILPVDLDR
jgi:hypothetical protein